MLINKKMGGGVLNLDVGRHAGALGRGEALLVAIQKLPLKMGRGKVLTHLLPPGIGNS